MTTLDKCRMAEGAIHAHLVSRLRSESLVTAQRAVELDSAPLHDVLEEVFLHTPMVAVPVAGEMLVFQSSERAQ